MINEAQALALLEEVNPVPDLDAYEVAEPDLAAYLATLTERSSEMTRLDTQKPSPERTRRPITPWLVAALLVAIVGVAVILVSQNPDEAPFVDEPTVTTIAESAPTTVALEAPTTIAETAQTTVAVDEWEQIPTFEEAGNAGEYRSPSQFRIPMSATLPDGWEIYKSEDEYFAVSPTVERCTILPGGPTMDDPGCRGVVFVDWTNSTDDEVFAMLQQQADLLTVSEPYEATLGGRPATAIDGTPSESLTIFELAPEIEYEFHPTWLFRVYLADVNGRTAIVYVEDHQQGAFFEEAQPIVDSIVWKDA